MWKRLAMLWTVVKSDARLLWLALRHPEAPGWLKAGAVGIALYALSPIDLIPDFIPVLGLLDDIILVPLAIRWLYRQLPARLRADVERQAAGRNTPPADVAAPRR